MDSAGIQCHGSHRNLATRLVGSETRQGDGIDGCGAAKIAARKWRRSLEERKRSKQGFEG